MKRLLTVVLALSLLLSNAACTAELAPSATKHKLITTSENSEPTETTPEESVQPEEPENPKEPDDPSSDQPVALKIGDHKIGDAELTYFYIDAVQQWYISYGEYAAYFGLDASKGLDQQNYDPSTNKTWADYFMDLAIDNAKNTYALCDAAKAAAFQFSQEQEDYIADLYAELEANANEQKVSVDELLQKVYGEIAEESTYKKYYEATVLASAYYAHYTNALKNSYTSDQLRSFEGNEGYKYNSYSYASYYLNLSSFKADGIQDPEEYLKKTADQLAHASINTVDLLNQAIAKMEEHLREYTGAPSLNEHSTATAYTKVLYSKVLPLMQEWMRDDNRKTGDIIALADETTSKDANGKETKTLKGYYIVLFQERHDNQIPLANVRHILVSFEGGTYNSTTGSTTYSDAEKKAAKDKADKLLAEWKNGAATEDSFAEMANKHSADGDGTTGGLYEDVYPGQMVTNFNDWCFDESRKAGDTGIVESVYGYHVMYYVSDSDENFRDYMVKHDLLSQDVDNWQKTLLENIKVKKVNINRIDKDLILSPPSNELYT